MLAIIGGTGQEGLGLALRFLLADEDVIIGSRSLDNALTAVEELKTILDSTTTYGINQSPKLLGSVNKEAARLGDIVVIAVPFDAQEYILSELRESIDRKIIINTVVPLQFANGAIKTLTVQEGSAAEQSQRILPSAVVISAFHNLSAESLLDLNNDLDCDVIVCGSDKESKAKVMALASKMGRIRAIDGGNLDNSKYIENLTAILININKIYGTNSSIKITGI